MNTDKIMTPGEAGGEPKHSDLKRNDEESRNSGTATHRMGPGLWRVVVETGRRECKQSSSRSKGRREEGHRRTKTRAEKKW
jgi:hypothetical protein